MCLHHLKIGSTATLHLIHYMVFLIILLHLHQAIIQSYSALNTESLTYDADVVWVGPFENIIGGTSMKEREDLVLMYENESIQLYQFRTVKPLY